MALSSGLIRLAAVIFATIGLGYLVAPATMLAIVGIDGESTANFLIRTEGVALVAGAGLLWAVRSGTSRQRQLALIALAFYYVVGSLVDLAALNDSIVGSAAVPSAVVRIALGVVCLVAAWRDRSTASQPTMGS